MLFGCDAHRLQPLPHLICISLFRWFKTVTRPLIYCRVSPRMVFRALQNVIFFISLKVFVYSVSVGICYFFWSLFCIVHPLSPNPSSPFFICYGIDRLQLVILICSVKLTLLVSGLVFKLNSYYSNDRPVFGGRVIEQANIIQKNVRSVHATLTNTVRWHVKAVQRASLGQTTKTWY